MSSGTLARLQPGPEEAVFLGSCLGVPGGGIALIDRAGKLVFVSEEAARMLALAAMPKPAAPLEILPGPVQDLVREGLSSRSPVTSRQVELAAGARGKVMVAVTVHSLPAATAGVRAVLVLNDITAARRLDANLRHFDRLASLGTVSAGMAHEIRNALVAGKTFFDLLFDRYHDAELVSVARREISRIEAIVTRMLRFVGRTQPSFREVHLHDILEQSLRLVQPRIEDKAITLHRSLLAAPDRVKGDEVQLQQAFVNLFLNALEAMGANGTLTVTTETLDGQLRLTIRDTGAGIPAENLPRLFE
ncbi:MAG TPA: ATP-binding protein, partial [Candidatus Acidoferrum sp.]|nr:ATP-binding protein [Candidatus Acidoferrum sp.]